MTGSWRHDSMELMLSQTRRPYYHGYSRRRTLCRLQIVASTYRYFGDSSSHLYIDTSDALTIRSSRCSMTTRPEHTALLFRRGGPFPPAWLPRSHSSTSVQPTRRAMKVSSCLCGTENSPRYSAPMRTGIQGIPLDILLCHDGERSWMPNAKSVSERIWQRSHQVKPNPVRV
jgi:hypothetical protein